MAKPTINDVARTALVSKRTVSRVLNREPGVSAVMRQKVGQTIDWLGFVPDPDAQLLGSGGTSLVGLVHDGSDAQMAIEVQEVMCDVLRDTGRDITVQSLAFGDHALAELLERFISRHRLRELIVLPPLSDRFEIAMVCAQLGCRYVRLGSAIIDLPERMISSGDRAAMRVAAKMLFGEGHRRIALVCGPAALLSARERFIGALEGLRDLGVPPSRTLIASGDNSLESGIVAGRTLLDQRPPPTAVMACSDLMAAGVIAHARLQGMNVPADLSVVGFGDAPVAACTWPPITTIRRPFRSMARSATMRLIGLDASEACEGALTFECSMVARRSVAPPRSASRFSADRG